jgi:serine/threonine protein kinase
VPQPTLEPLRRWEPERIGPYVLLGRLGAGAMGRVYLGRSTAGRLVAVKTIKIELADEAGFRARFAHEVAAARRVSGVFTAAVVAADPEADMPWLATAYVPAPSLSQLVAECGPLPVPAARWLAAGCAEALESIHSAGLVHRDLKPSNVLVSPDGPRVIDFGVARAAERVQLTVTRGAVGTPAYMAPEQARDTRQASVASDMFSLGATLAFAATGHAPYQGETVMDVLVKLATDPPDLTGLPGTDGIVTACLARSPGQRPTSAAGSPASSGFAATPAGRARPTPTCPPRRWPSSVVPHGPRPTVRAPADGDAADHRPPRPGENSRAHGDTTSGALGHQRQHRHRRGRGDVRLRRRSRRRPPAPA